MPSELRFDYRLQKYRYKNDILFPLRPSWLASDAALLHSYDQRRIFLGLDSQMQMNIGFGSGRASTFVQSFIIPKNITHNKLPPKY